MWLLHLLPMGLIALIVHGVLLLGIIGLAASYLIKIIPSMELYSGVVRIASIVILITAVYMEGVYNTHLWYQNQVKSLQEQITLSETKSKTLVNTQQATIKTNAQTILSHTDTVHTIIREKLVPIDKECTLNPQVITVLNDGATNPLDNAAKQVEKK